MFSKVLADAGLKERLKTAGILIAAFSVLLVFGALSCTGHLLLVSTGFIIVALACWEFANFTTLQLCIVKKLLHFSLAVAVPLLTTGVILNTGLCGDNQVISYGYYIAGQGFFIAFAFSLLYMLLIGRSDLSLASKLAADLLPGVFLVGFCGSLMILVSAYGDASRILLWLLLVVCLNDSGAYFVGRRVGGPKLAPALSPNKTISGSLGGLAMGVLAGIVFSGLIRGFSVSDAWFVSTLCVAAAQVGDLLKSYLKRLHNVKDSGSILPGHGGVLDRIDGILFASPVLLSWLLASRAVLG